MSLPQGFVPQPEDVDYADDLHAMAALIGHCTKRPGRCNLLLSTCRNAYLTLNALYVDAQALFGNTEQFTGLVAACDGLLRHPASQIAFTRLNATRALQVADEFDTKRTVWATRYELLEEIELARMSLQTEEPKLADRVGILLEHMRRPRKDSMDGWDRDLLELNLEALPHLEHQYEALWSIQQTLRAAAKLAFHFANLLADTPEQGLFPLAEGEQAHDIWGRLREKLGKWVRKLADACGWLVDDAPGGLRVEIIGPYPRPSNQEPVSDILVLFPQNGSQADQTGPQLGKLVREAQYWAHGLSRSTFKLNVASRALPPPFEIALEPPSQQTALSNQIPQVDIIRCSARERHDQTRIAVANLCLPKSKLDAFVIAEDAAERAAMDAELCLRSAVDEGCRAILFPEYSIPASAKERLEFLAKEHRITIVAGLEGTYFDRKLTDRALVALPSGKSHFQYKQRPSLEEERTLFKDGVFRLFVDSDVGDFAVVICSDVMQLPTLQAWSTKGRLPELVFLIARNPYVDLFRYLAKAYAMQLYACVIIANIDDSGEEATADGSGAFLPVRPRLELIGSKKEIPTGSFARGIEIFDIPLGALRAASRGKSSSHFFAVPEAVRRG